MKQNDNIEFELMEAFTSEKSDKDIGMPDIEQELAMVKEKHSRQTFLPMRKIAASVAIIMALSGITLAAVVNSDRLAQFFIHNKEEMPVSAVTKTSVTKKSDLIIMPSDTVVVQKGDIIFDDTCLADIMTSISNNYHINVEFSNKELKSIRLHFRYNTSDSIEDVIKTLNMFEKIKVRYDNEKLEVE